MKIAIAAIGLAAPGFANWCDGSDFFQSGIAYDSSAEMLPMVPSLLPVNERRRTTQLIKLALQSGQDALDKWSGDVGELATVFANSDGDLEIVDKIMIALGMDGKPVSPTHFHNSVHNAPAGYWSIATRSRAPSTSISAFDASFSAGLLEAAAQVIDEKRDVLLVSYDIPPPPTLHSFRPLVAPFAAALLLTMKDGVEAQAQIEISLMADDNNQSTLTDINLESLRRDNPAARCLPLLLQLANKGLGEVTIPYLSGQALHIKVMPC
jgi:hypothetical protein